MATDRSVGGVPYVVIGDTHVARGACASLLQRGSDTRALPRSGHVVVVGLGQVGLRLCQELQRLGVGT